MVTPQVSLLLAASIAVASYTPLLAASGSCEAPGRRQESAAIAGHVLLQTRTRNSAALSQLSDVASPQLLDVPSNRDGSLPDGMSLLTTRLGSWSLAAHALTASTRRPQIPLGVPGSAASLLAVLAEGARNEPIPKSKRSGMPYLVKISILVALSLVAVFCCVSAYHDEMQQRDAAAEVDIHRALQLAGFEVGRDVVTTKTFMSDEETRTHILEQQVGVILRIDKEGDVLVKFKDVATHPNGQWVFSWRVLEVLQVASERWPARDTTTSTDEHTQPPPDDRHG